MRCLKVAVCIIVIFALSATQPIYIQAMDKNVSSKITINLPSRTLDYYENDKLVKEYLVAIGKPSTPSPMGIFKIIDKEVNPSWYPPDKPGYVVPSGPANPLGYRWMGFRANYGIHGTNAPWSIGLVVSNGCIRMHEEDVEELFPKVQYNTPVYLTYDRVKILFQKTGQASIGVYPDVYGYENITLEQVKEKLMAEGLGNLVTDDFLSKLILEEKGEQVVFATLYNMKINNKQLSQYLVRWENTIYAPVLAVSHSLDIPIEWDAQQQLIVGRQHTVQGMMKQNILYVAANDLPILFGAKQYWDEPNHCLLMNAPQLLMEGQPITHNVQRIDNSRYVPISKVAKAFGKKLYWEPGDNAAWLGSRKISVTTLADEAYIEASKISEYFNASATWDEDLQTLDMNYFYGAIDYSMYLGEMGDFID